MEVSNTVDTNANIHQQLKVWTNYLILLYLILSPLYVDATDIKKYERMEQLFVACGNMYFDTVIFSHGAAHSNCQFDGVKIYNLATGSHPIATLCGSNIPGPFSAFGSMLLNFYSDSVISSSGFMAEYKTYRKW